MAEFARTVVSRLRKYVGDRRVTKRQAVRLDLSLWLASASKGLNGTKRIDSMAGHTHDVSSNGLAVIVPRITLGDHHLVGENRAINLKVELPDGPVEMQTAPVRYERLEDNTLETGYLIAVKIIAINDHDRKRFSDYVEALRKTR